MKTAIYEDVVNFLVDKLPPEEVIAFRPSLRAQKQFNELLNIIKSGNASAEQRAEMEQSLQIEHMMQLAKARARAKMAAQMEAQKEAVAAPQ